ncbi:radical SAM protein [Rhizobium rhizogenes]|uniref:radical SAM protein n=1 Tax=Rhizobium rhizogenes TaxID=359 RepID=UPI001573424B|nr:hypothetical protein [Rhizobium rhizogenes]NTI31330.1 hypothetical protein [Rhizobium rhizogenes]
MEIQTIGSADNSQQLSDDVVRYFSDSKSSFGSLNLLDGHLPSRAEEIRLVENNLDIILSINLAFPELGYEDFANDFALKNPIYLRHVKSFNERFIANREAIFLEKVHKSIKTVNIFTPPLCNMACNGCYTNAQSSLKFPFRATALDSYFSNFQNVLRGARSLGAEMVYTAGDGEILSYPKFFDMAQEIRANGMTWLFFTAGLCISSERAARAACNDMLEFASLEVRHALGALIDKSESKTPCRDSLISMLSEYRDVIKVYHSLWSADSATNSDLRNPLLGDYEYVSTQGSDGQSLRIPSSIIALKDRVFQKKTEGKFGIQMPIADFSESGIVPIANFIKEHQLSSYFEPVIVTGRNKKHVISETSERLLNTYSPLMVRKACGFRNIYQPTFKSLDSGGVSEWYSSPGMGISIKDIVAFGGDANKVVNYDEDIFPSIFSPLNIYCNLKYSYGCKCNDIYQKLENDKNGILGEMNSVTRGRKRVGKNDIARQLSRHHI